MNILNLRQRKLLHLIQTKNRLTTGAELARELNVSDRTIRSDVAELNQMLSAYGAGIHSQKGKGYSFYVDDPVIFEERSRIDTAFFTPEDRVRYLAFQFCLSDEPISIFDLEDEMFVSHTTIENDLHHLRSKYVLSKPYIQLKTEKNTLSFESDEIKKRDILNMLFHEDWNYNTKGNAYYDYHFLDPELLEFIMKDTPRHLYRYNIELQDACLVSLNLSLAIMHYRCITGHTLSDRPTCEKPDIAAKNAAEDIISSLESKVRYCFSQTEKDVIYQKIANAHLPDPAVLNRRTADYYFDSLTHTMVRLYIDKISHIFSIDFSDDEEFYITLLRFIHYLRTPSPLFNKQENISLAKDSLQIEYELAWLFQEIAMKLMERFLDETELLNMAYCLSGALEYLYRNHPEKKLRTVISCHLSFCEAWALKRKLLGAFDNFINIEILMPVNKKNHYDFTDTDLVLTTVNKKMTDSPNTDVLQLSTLLTGDDYQNLVKYISFKRLLRYYHKPDITWQSFVSGCWWYENLEFKNRFSLINYQAENFIHNKIVREDFTESILRRESISSFAYQPGILLIYSHIPADKTQGSIIILKHRINWNAYRIRAIVMVSFTTNDLPFLFQLKSIISSFNKSCDIGNMCKTKENFIDLFNKEKIF